MLIQVQRMIEVPDWKNGWGKHSLVGDLMNVKGDGGKWKWDNKVSVMMEKFPKV